MSTALRLPAVFKPVQLRAFLAVAENKSLRAASKVLFVSQPAVTRIIRELEDELGVPLVIRGTRGVELTAYGQAFWRRASLLVEESGRAREELRQMKDGLTASITFAVGSLPSTLILPAAFCRFRRQMPKAQVHCTEGVLPVALAALRRGQLDFMLTQFPDEQLEADLCHELLFTTPLAIGARTAHPRIHIRSLAALQADEWLGWDKPFVQSLYTRLGMPAPEQIVIASSFEVARGLVEHTDVLGIFPLPVLRRELRGHGIRQVKVREALPNFSISIVTRAGARLTPAAACFLDIVRGVAKDLAAASHETTT